MNAAAHAGFHLNPPASRTNTSPASAVGQRLSELLLEFAAHARNNASDWRSFTNALIEDVARQHSTPGWDGYGARPIDSRAKAEAQRFVQLLPFGLQPPVPAPDPEGDMALSWDLGSDHVLTVSINANGTVTYAGLLGGGVKRYGMEQLGDDIPQVILQTLEDLYQRATVVR